MRLAADPLARMLEVAHTALTASGTPRLNHWTPQPGPQAELFLCDCDEILYGGAAGGGKTSSIVALLSGRVQMRGYRALLLRRSTPDLKGLIDEARAIYLDGRPAGKFAFRPFAPPPLARFREDKGWMIFTAWGSRLEFGHCHDAEAYRSHMGQQYDDIVFDEGTQFTQTQYEAIITRRRGTISGIRRRAIVTANPPEHNEPGEGWVRAKWAPWLDPSAAVDAWTETDDQGNKVCGVGLPPRSEGARRLPPARSGQVLYVAKVRGAERFSAAPFTWNGAKAETRTFIRSTLSDNPAMLEAEPNYRGKLRSVNAVRAQQLEDGDWTVRYVRGGMFQRTWFEMVDSRPDEREVVGRVRAWDKAATEPTTANPDPNWTRGVKMAKLKDGSLLVENMVSTRAAPGERDALILATAKLDGPGVKVRGPQDPAAAGKSDAVAFRKLLEGFTVKTEPVSGDKVMRAGPASSLAHPKSTGGQHGRIKVLRGPWNEEFLSELESFPHGAHDDIVDAFADAVEELMNHTTASAETLPPPMTYNFDAQTLGI